MTTAAALTVREDAAGTAPRPHRSWRSSSRPGVVALLVATALTRFGWPDGVGLGGGGGVVDRAVAWSGSQSWEALFFGTLDPAGATPVGAPAAGWLGSLVLRVSASADLAVLATVLVVLAVAVLAAAVRRAAGRGAGLLAGGALALFLRSGGEAQPALLLAVAGYCVVRFQGRVRWLLGAGWATGSSVLVGGWTGAVGLVLVVGLLVLRAGSRRRVALHAAVVTGTAALPVAVWLLVAAAWPGSHPVPAGIWSGQVAGVLAPAAAAALALGAARWWAHRRAGVRVVLVLALVLGVGGGVAVRPPDVTRVATVDAPVVALLRDAGTTWSAAAVGYPAAAALELSTGTSVLALDASAGTTTLAQFQSYVATGRVRYLLAPTGSTSGGTADVLAWVAAGHPATTVGGTTVYDLTS